MNPRRQRFVEEYLKDLNATQAAQRAGYSPRTAKSQGQRLLTFVEVQSELQKRMQHLAKRNELDADWIIRKLQEEYEISSEEGKRSSAIKALELLGRHLGLFSDKPREDPTESVEVVLKQIWQKQSV